MKKFKEGIEWLIRLFRPKTKQETVNNGSVRPRKQWRNRMKINGVVKFFNKEKGFGFITMGNKDIFVHISKIEGGAELGPGDEVKFGIGQNNKGDVAVDVELVKKGDPAQRNDRRNDRRPRGNDARF